MLLLALHLSLLIGSAALVRRPTTTGMYAPSTRHWPMAQGRARLPPLPWPWALLAATPVQHRRCGATAPLHPAPPHLTPPGLLPLHMPRGLPPPSPTVAGRYSLEAKVGQVVEGTVQSVRPHEVVVRLGPGALGMLHARQVSMACMEGKEVLKQLFPRGSPIKALVLSQDADSGYTSLGTKQLERQPGVESGWAWSVCVLRA